jgi:putative transposase
MAKSRHTAEQIIAILREGERDESVPEVARRHGISEQTFYRWKRKYGGTGKSEIARLKALEQENAKLKQLVGDQVLALQVLKDLLGKRGWA